MSFHKLGAIKAEKDIENQEQSPVSTSIKPFSFKMPIHIVEAMDISASHMGISRNQLLNTIVESFFAQSFVDWVDGYKSLFVTNHKTEAQFILEEANTAIHASNYSDEAVKYFEHSIMSYIQEHDIATDVYKSFVDGKLSTLENEDD